MKKSVKAGYNEAKSGKSGGKAHEKKESKSFKKGEAAGVKLFAKTQKGTKKSKTK